ncbi:MAG: hypothetical protein ABIP19_01130 [Dermatophilaceae bacterium]
MNSKQRRVRLIVAALALMVAGVVGAASYATNGGRDYLGTPSSADQCDLPVAERTGGWFCYGP